MLLLESQHKLIDLECELSEHERCLHTIEKYKQEVEKLKQEQEKHLETIEKLKSEMTGLKSEMSLNKDKESLLIEMKSDLESELHNSKTYITEVRMKLSEVSDIEEKCKNLEKKIEELVEENNCKYIEIVDLIENREKLQKLLDEKTSCLENMQDLQTRYKEMEKEKNKMQERLNLLEKHTENADNLLWKYKNFEKERDSLKTAFELAVKAEKEIEDAYQIISAENCSLKESTSALEDCIKTLSVANKELIEEINNLEKKCNNLEEEFATKEKDYCKKLEEYEKALEEAQKTSEELKYNNEQIQEEIGLKVDKKVEELEDELKNLSEKLDNKEKEVQDLELRVTASKTNLEHEIKDQKLEIERLLDQIQNLESVNDNLFKGIGVYETDLCTKNDETSKQKEIIDMQNCKIKELERSCEIRDALVSELTAENAQQKLSIGTLKSEVQYYNENIKMLKNLNNELQMSVREKTADCEALNKKYAEIKKVNGNLCDELIKIRDENKNLKEAVNQNLKQIQNLTQQKENMENDRKKNQQAFEKLQKENEFITNCKADLEEKLSKLLSEKKDWLRQKTSDAELLETLHDKLFSAKVAIDDLEYKKSCEEFPQVASEKDLEEELTKMKADFELQQTTIDFLMQERQSLLEEKSKWNEAKEELTKKIAESMMEVSQLNSKLEKSETNSEASSEVCNSCRMLSDEADEVRSKNGDDKRPKQKGGFGKMQIKLERLQCKVESLEKSLENEKKKSSTLENRLHEKQVSSTTCGEYSIDKCNAKFYEENLLLKQQLSNMSNSLLKAEQDIANLRKLRGTESNEEDSEKKKVKGKRGGNAVAEITRMRCKLHESNSKLASLLEEVESVNNGQFMDGDTVAR